MNALLIRLKYNFFCMLSVAVYALRLFRGKTTETKLFGSGFQGITSSHFDNFCSYSGKKAWVFVGKNIGHNIPHNLVKKWSFRYFYLLSQSNEWHVSHNPKDVFPVKIKGIRIINYWHGYPIKYIGHDSLVEAKWIKSYKKANLPLPYEVCDVYYAYNESMSDILQRAFDIPGSKILIRPPPKLSKTFDKRLLFDIVCLPTYRSGQDEENAVITELLCRLRSSYPSESVGIRFHPHSQFSCFDYLQTYNIVAIESGFSVNELLARTSLVVSDYSSVVYDAFYVFNKSVCLIQPDIDSYSEKYGGLYDVSIPVRRL